MPFKKYLLTTLLFLALSSNIQAAEYAPDSILVKYKPGFSPTEVASALQKRERNVDKAKAFQQSTEIFEEYKTSNLFISKVNEGSIEEVNIGKGDLEEVIEKLKSVPGVEYVEYNHKIKALSVPTETYYLGNNNPINSSGQWYLKSSGMEQVWDVAENNANVLVAVIDTGINYHKDISGEIKQALNCRGVVECVEVPLGEHTDEYGGHGTSVAGVIGATHNGKGVAGAYKNHSPQPFIVSLKALSDSGTGYVSDSLRAYDYLVKNYTGQKVVVNMSLGCSGNCNSEIEEDLINQMHNAGFILVAASGNEGNKVPSYPGGYEKVLGVGSININDQKTPYSQYGKGWTDIATYGGDIPTDTGILALNIITFNPDEDIDYTWHYKNMQGTSFSTPLTSGVIATIWNTVPSLSNNQLLDIIKNTATPVQATSDYWKHGKLSPLTAIQAAKATVVTPPPVEPPVEPPEEEEITFDVDKNGVVDVFDLIEYLDVYFAATPTYNASHDYNSDNLCNVFDLLALLEEVI